MRLRLHQTFMFAALVAALPMPAQQQDYQLRVTVNLVRVDATVTDAKGNPIPDLKPEEFRMLLDGKPQRLKNADYIPLRPPTSQPATETAKSVSISAQPAMPGVTLKRDQVRRTIVIFVADLLTSAESMPGIRTGLKKFVEQQVQPGDLVAIVRSSAGLGALQDFTPDKHMLLAAVDQVRWPHDSVGLATASAYAPIINLAAPPIAAGMDRLGQINLIERATLTTTASLSRVLKGMEDLPGRKSLVVVSDGLRLNLPDELEPGSGPAAIGTGAFVAPIVGSMRRIVDESVRAGVVLYVVDTRGLTSLTGTAADHIANSEQASGGPANVVYGAGDTPLDVRDKTQSRRDDYKDNQWGGLFISSQTGGFMVTESNRLDSDLGRIMDDQRGYYILAFQPPPEAMEPDRNGNPVFHRLKIEVRRPGAKIRSHAGFFGVADAERPTHPELTLINSLDSPFQSTGIHMDIESSYLSVKNDYLLRTTLFIDGKDVKFDGPPIHRTGTVHVILRAFDAAGGTLEGGIDQVRRIDLNEDGYDRARKYGLIYSTMLQVKKAGPYQVRAALRDEGTGNIGTAGDFVSIPKPKQKGVQISSIVFQHAMGTDDHVIPAARPTAYTPGQSAQFVVQLVASGTALKADGLAMRLHLFRDGVDVWKSEPIAVGTAANIAVTKNSPMLLVKGAIDIPKGLEPGKYLLRVDLTDKAQPDTVTAWQWAKLTLE